MLSKYKILAVVVTHNRNELLIRCIDYLQKQSRKPDHILVINNGSTDNTEEVLRQRGVHYITQDNVGSAGGWYRGIEYALEEGFDAIWLMDDDGYPDPEALNLLEQALHPSISCVSSVVLREDKPTHFVFPFSVLDKNDLPVVFTFPRKVPTLKGLSRITNGGMYPFAHLFNGALVSIEAVRQIGNINRDLFLSGDEVDYFFRLRKFGPVYSVLSAHHFHPDVSIRPFTPAKLYYYVKNTLILNKRYFNFVLLRNILTIVAALGRLTSRNGLWGALSYVAGRNAITFYRAILRGLRGQVGKDFDG
ncbi:MAG: glycosyltransferase [Deltaproteobacteria bacterium]|nr:glycosyltransferase [Deltaproteobacteria bacterium]